MNDFLVLYIILLIGKLDVQTFERFEGRSRFDPQKQIAKILSFTNSAYAKIERGEHTLTASIGNSLTNLRNVSTDYLLELTDFT